MKILSEHQTEQTPKVATIGFFDGVHLGHDFLLKQLRLYSEQRSAASMVVTFSNHPRLFFQPQCRLHQLTLSDEKLNKLETKNIDYCLMLQFTEHIARMTSFDFMKMLVTQYGVTTLLVGYDHHFGSDTSTPFDQYVAQGKSLGLEVKRCVEHVEHYLVVSSSKIRHALELWDINLANQLLGYNYTLTGTVVYGSQIGRQIGFPTANIQVDSLKFIPSEGVYSVRVYLSSTEVYKGMVNIGRRPTVNGKNLTIEVHIIGFSGDIYGQTVTLEFLNFIRHEEKYSSLDALKRQLKQDLESL